MKSVTKILLVDDDRAVLQFFARVLRTAGYEVSTASDGEEALAMAWETKPNLVLLDVVLPGLSGLEVCRRIKSDPAMSDVFVVLASGQALETDSKVSGLETGADDYLPKPIDLREFLARIRTVVRLQQTTAALREREEHYRTLLQMLPIAVATIDFQGQITEVNPEAVSMFGYSDPSELISNNLLDRTDEKDRQRLQKSLEDIAQRRPVENSEFMLVRKDGARVLVDTSAAVMRSSSGQTALVAVARDITESKRAEARIRELLELLNDAQGAVVVGGLDKGIRYFNKGAEKLLGWKIEEVSDAALPELILEGTDTPEAIRKELLSVGEWGGELGVRTKDKQKLIVLSSWKLVRSRSDQSPQVVLTMTDVTERKRAQELLRQRQEMSQRIISTAMDGFCILELSGKLIDVNEAYCAMTGYTRAELLGMSFSQVEVNEEAAGDIRERLQRIMAVGAGRFETRHKCKNGTLIFVEVSASVLHAGENRLFAFVRNITDRKKAEQDLRDWSRRITEAQEAERMRVARELHDGVNMLIASAKMHLRNALSSMNPVTPAAREILSRCETLLVRALDENRAIAHNLRPAELDQLGLAAACQNFCKHVQKHAGLEVKCQVGQLDVRLNPTVELHLFRIMQEAIHNAVKHAQAKTIRLRIGLEENCVLMRVKDDGRGFEKAAAEADENKKGGTGLMNMRERAASMGGTCQMHSSKSGTAITVRVPVKIIR